MTGLIAGSAWTMLPFITGYIDYFFQRNIDEEIDRNKYFGLVMWLPENVNTSPTYELMQLAHAFALYTIVSNMIACNIIMMAMMKNVSTHFSILSSALETIDSIDLETNKATSFSGRSRSSYIINRENKTAGQTEHTFNNTTAVPQTQSFADHEYDNTSLTTSVMSTENMDGIEFQTSCEDSLSNVGWCHYLIQSIKYHQFLIE